MSHLRGNLTTFFISLIKVRREKNEKKKKIPFQETSTIFSLSCVLTRQMVKTSFHCAVSLHIQSMPVEFSSEHSHSSCGLSLWLADVSGSLAKKDIFETVCAASDSGDLLELLFLLCQVFISHPCRRVLHINVCVDSDLEVILGLLGPTLCVHRFQEWEIAGIISPGL